MTLKTFSKPTRTRASDAYNTNLAAMVAGRIPFSQSRQPAMYLDDTLFSDSLADARNQVILAEQAFMQLPPQVREAFGNDPASLASALGDPSQASMLQDLGLLPPSEPSPRQAPPEPSDDGSVKGEEKAT